MRSPDDGRRRLTPARGTIIVLLAIVLCAVFPRVAAAAETGQPDRPNVLFLFADDQRPGAIAALGNEHIRTPNLDRLVESGTTFTNAYCMGSWSGAVCLPSRAMVNSGRTLWRIDPQLEGQATWGQTMRGGGYTAFGTGKWHNGGASFLRSFNRGDAVFLGGMSDHFNVPTRRLNEEGKLQGYDSGGRHSSELFADAAVDFLDQRVSGNADNDNPFFMYVAFTAPHDPRDPPRRYRQQYYEDRPPLPENFMPQHPFDNGEMVLRDEVLAAWPRTEDAVRDQLAEYYGLITHMDEQIGRILDALRETGEYDNTLIVFAADHGLAIGSHGLLGKQNLYEHSMKAPLVFAGPGIPEGQRRDALVYLLDIFPTVCELTDLPVPDEVEGESLAGVITGEEDAVRDSLYTAYRGVQRAVRDERWKLIRYPQIDHTQLFDLHDDPNELSNLAADPAHADTVDRLTARLEQWQRELGDDQPLRVENPEPKEIDLTGRSRKPDRHQPDWIREKYFDDGE